MDLFRTYSALSTHVGPLLCVSLCGEGAEKGHSIVSIKILDYYMYI